MEQFYFLSRPAKLPKKDTLNFILNFSKSIEIIPSKQLECITLAKN